MAATIRRVVTTETGQGHSTVLLDGPVSCAADIVEGLRLSDIWMSAAGTPFLYPAADLMAGRVVELSPPQSGTRVRLFELPPDADYLDRVSSEDLLGGIGAAHQLGEAAHPGMHKTPTLDYVVVIRGRVHLVLDEAEVELGPGDCVVQGGVSHAWSNRADEPALLAAVLVAAE